MISLLGGGYYALAAVTSLLAFTKEISTLKMMNVTVPAVAYWNEPVILECLYDLQYDTLYSITWYKDNDEFYRFKPKSHPPQTSYRIDDIRVDLIHSDLRKVRIKNINFKASGIYKCEVSAEAPAFMTVSREARMDVIALPRDDPKIMGERKEYQVGDDVTLNCTSGKSNPPAKLRWFINGEPVNATYEANIVEPGGFSSAVSRLKMTAAPHHFFQGQMQIRCQATISVANGNNHGNRNYTALQQRHHQQTNSKQKYQREAFISLRGGQSSKLRKNLSLIVFLLVIRLNV